MQQKEYSMKALDLTKHRYNTRAMIERNLHLHHQKLLLANVFDVACIAWIFLFIFLGG